MITLNLRLGRWLLSILDESFLDGFPRAQTLGVNSYGLLLFRLSWFLQFSVPFRLTRRLQLVICLSYALYKYTTYMAIHVLKILSTKRNTPS